MTIEIKTFSQALLNGEVLLSRTLDLDLGECTLRVHSNSEILLERLNAYFSHLVTTLVQPDIEVKAIESMTPNLDVEFYDWRRETGKTGRKDSCYDFAGGRLIHKVRTGMVFLQSQTEKIAAGPCLENDNQVINFINNQYMTWLQQREWLICHASALIKGNKALAVAGFSGGGKSTLMLHMLEQEDTYFMTNDRLFIKHENDNALAAGIPKLPRINPGTIVNNPRLSSLIPKPRQQELMSLPKSELWELEEKYDVDIERYYGKGRIKATAPLSALLILSWHRDDKNALAVQQVDLQERRDLLAAVMKSPGPFYQRANGAFFSDELDFDEHAYIAALSETKVYEATGCVDFTALADWYLNDALTADND